MAIAAMVKCGVTHPPAGATALIFASGGRPWKQVGMMIVGNVVALLCATLINNLSDQRAYPTFWGFRELNDWWDARFGDKEKTKEEEKKVS